MNTRVVLVRPEIAANLGAAARAMRNFGLNDLVLVAPVASPTDHQARVLATHGEEVLDRCRVEGDLGGAVADCVLVAGTSARTGGLFRRQAVRAPDKVMPHVVDALASGPAALVFGPESSGLTNEEVARCHYLIHVPTDPAAPALNLAQAIAVCLYELRRTWLRRAAPSEAPEPAAPFADQERMFVRLRAALERIEFLFGDRADALMFGMRHLLGRARPTPMEVKLLLGLARQIEWFAGHRAGGRGRTTSRASEDSARNSTSEDSPPQ